MTEEAARWAADWLSDPEHATYAALVLAAICALAAHDHKSPEERERERADALQEQNRALQEQNDALQESLQAAVSSADRLPEDTQQERQQT